MPKSKVTKTPDKAEEKNAETGKKIPKCPQLLRGMKDILPESQKHWNYVRKIVEELAEDYTYERIDTPILEETSLFARSVGENTDIVEKEMFSFEDKGGTKVSLRPENTAGIVRAYIEHGMLDRPQPVRFFYWGPFFRYDRPQAGRYRQFNQFGFEAIGDSNPIIDAQLIVMCQSLYQTIGLPVVTQINSVGCKECRKEYEQLLTDYLSSRKKFLCEDCKRRLTKNTLRVLDCKEKECKEILADAPHIVDHLDEECKAHFVKVLEYLDEADITYQLNPFLVRGLDYYTKTTFEIWPEKEEGSQSALGGGGRYDDLVEVLGGRPTPACGFAGGIERLIISMREKEIVIPPPEPPDVFVAQLGESAKKKALRLVEDLRQKGIRAASNFSTEGLKYQLSVAAKLKVRFSLILGQKEMLDKTILLRDMEGGSQEVVDYNKVYDELKKRMEKVKAIIKNGNNHSEE
ncbi:histidine--tRNA ligase [Patescibacteria group bacterium]|nr:histidine--tRNA ligase [Patescibacteria group bacterium]